MKSEVLSVKSLSAFRRKLQQSYLDFFCLRMCLLY